MKRPWQVWLLFAACVLAACAGMTWLTRQALQADERRRGAEAETELEQRVSLALWRMDTELAPIIAAEVIRSPGAFRPTGGRPEEPPPYVLMQFEAQQDGQWLSPQSVGKLTQKPAELTELSAAVRVPQLIAMLPNTPLPTAADIGKNLAANSGPLPTLGENSLQFVEGNRSNLQLQQEQQKADEPGALGANQLGAPNRAADFQQRGQRYQTVAQQNLLNSPQIAVPNYEDLRQSVNRSGTLTINSGGPLPEHVGVSRPVWIGDRLLLARRVSRGDDIVAQGSWLDWQKIKSRLLAEAADLLPKADLVAVNDNAATDPGRMLAGLPVKLVVGETLMAGTVSPALRWALQLGWGGVLLAVIAAAFLLQGVMTLSERRAAFVSSVTHELRTPLTTFRMYAEMLAKGMVPDAARRQEYFNTLQSEAERLTLLVENVLSYARLERGRKPQAQDCVTLEGLLDRVGPRLKQRATQAGMQWDLRIDGAAAKQQITTDQAIVEQILFNLVDNAAKYAREATDKRIHVGADRNGQFVKLVVRDHGPGIKNGLWSRPMQPFGKSAQESAESAPGVGLGLALCRRLARQLGGRLEIANSTDGGAALTLLLPCA